MIQSNWHHEVLYLLSLTDLKSGLHLWKMVFWNITTLKLSCFLQIKLSSQLHIIHKIKLKAKGLITIVRT